MSTIKPPSKPPKPKNLKFVRASFAYKAKDSEELSFDQGDLLYILDDVSDPDWWKARCKGKEGFVPANFAEDDLNPFHDACKRGHLELLEECLENKIPVNVADKAGNTGLHWACRGGHQNCVERLLQLGSTLKVWTLLDSILVLLRSWQTSLATFLIIVGARGLDGYRLIVQYVKRI